MPKAKAKQKRGGSSSLQGYVIIKYVPQILLDLEQFQEKFQEKHKSHPDISFQ